MSLNDLSLINLYSKKNEINWDLTPINSFGADGALGYAPFP